MIVCHCFRVSDREIRQCAQDGARTVCDIGRECEAGAGCGGCRPAISQILDEAHEERRASRTFLPVLQTG
jgi:NAD(P)H-nitrite reductase large subunit